MYKRDRTMRKGCDGPIDHALRLLNRRLPPQKVVKHRAMMVDLVPELEDDILASVDTPLKV